MFFCTLYSFVSALPFIIFHFIRRTATLRARRPQTHINGVLSNKKCLYKSSYAAAAAAPKAAETFLSTHPGSYWILKVLTCSYGDFENEGVPTAKEFFGPTLKNQSSTASMQVYAGVSDDGAA